MTATIITIDPAEAARIKRERFAAIIGTVSDTVANAVTATLAAADAKDDLDTAKAAAGSTRTAAMLGLAAASLAGEWTVPELDMATEAIAAASKGNDESKAGKARRRSLATMLAEVKLAAHPRLREGIGALMAANGQAWSDAADKAAAAKKANLKHDNVLSRVMLREWHCLITMARAIVNDGEECPRDAHAVLAFAVARDPQRKSDGVAAMLTAAIDKLTEAAKLIPSPVPNLEAARRFLAMVTAADVAAAFVPADGKPISPEEAAAAAEAEAEAAKARMAASLAAIKAKQDEALLAAAERTAEAEAERAALIAKANAKAERARKRRVKADIKAHEMGKALASLPAAAE